MVSKPATLLLSEVFPPKTGGSGRWFWEIYRRMPRDGIVIAAGEDPRQDAFDATHRLRVERTPLSLPHWGIRSIRGLRGYARALAAVRRLARRNNVGRIDCGRILPEGWVAWMYKKWHRVPYVVYVHGEEMNYGIASRELGWMMRRVLAGAEFAIANSENTSKILHEGWGVPMTRIRLLHPGVDIERFVPAPRDPDVRARLGWGDRPVILTVGRLQKRKGHDRLIEALPVIREAVPDLLYSIVGDGQERERLVELARRVGVEECVQFCGETGDDQLTACYQQCDLFVLPNREVDGDIEGFGMVLLEAQACGKAVVAGASGGTAEAMDVGRTGRIVCCDRVEEIAAVVCELLRDSALRETMGDAAHHWTASHFGWDVLARQAAEILGNGDLA
jgi:phosphatidyl-myo-inositol dimannoside synthase